MNTRFLTALLLTSMVWAPAALARKWTDASGVFSVEAELVDFKDGTVRLKKTDGKTISIEGYMAVGTLEGVKKFEFTPESCECGRSKVNHFIEVELEEGVTTYKPGRFKLTGTFSASEVKEDGFVKSVYRLKIKKLD